MLMWLLLALLSLSFSAAAAGQAADSQALAQRAVEAERHGDFAGAISAFQQLIHSGADSPELRDNLGLAYYQLHDFSAALHEFRTALTTQPDLEPANLFSGLSLIKLQRPKEALLFLEKAHREEPQAAAPILAVAQAEIALNEVRRARDHYEDATHLDPRNAEAWYGLSIANRVLAEEELKSSRQAGEAAAASGVVKGRQFMDASETAMEQALRIDPDSVRARMILGESFRIAERYDDSIREYKAATLQKPTLAAAWAGLAASYSASGDDENAQKAAARAHELDPNDPETNALIAAIFLRQGKPDRAEPFAIRAIQEDSGLSSAHVILAKIYLARQQPKLALPELESAAKDDFDGSTHYLLATTLRQLGKTEAAALAMQKYKQLHAHVTPASK